MICPACGGSRWRHPRTDGCLLIDRCENCSALWMDAGELQQALREHTQLDPATLPSTRSLRCCPRCDQMMVAVHYPGTTILIDVCRTCSGVFLDAGEYRSIRHHITSARGSGPAPSTTHADTHVSAKQRRSDSAGRKRDDPPEASGV
ncbi:MAG: zf-TFIIB domain-containing protein, partial [Planctomycetaceae bacterium]|nr:zf-TFIIB domain-containing protein [Planctomycetaceae bacterium]